MNENTEKDESIISGRASFIVGLFAAFLTLYPFQDTVKSINLQLFGWNLTLNTLVGYFLLLLIFAAYLYGLNSIRYSSNILLNIKSLKIIESIAHFFYNLAFIFPILIFIFWLLSTLINYLLPYTHIIKKVNLFLDFVLIMVAIWSVILATYLFKTREREQIEELSKIKTYYNKLFEKTSKDDYKLALLSLFQALMASLEYILIEEVGWGIKRMPARRIIQIAQEKKILNQQEVAKIMDLMAIRNQIAHNLPSVTITKEQADFFLNQIWPIVRKFEKVKDLDNMATSWYKRDKLHIKN